MPQLRRTSPRRRSSPPFAISIASTAGGRSGPWLHRIVVNRAIDWARARTLRAELELVDAAAPASSPDVGSDVVEALSGLSPEHRAVIVLRHLLGYTPGEIARLLDLPRGTVNSRLRRGLDQLQETLP